MASGDWTLLEVTKLVASGLVPILVVIMGIRINRIAKTFEHIQWRNQKLIEKRIQIYDELAPLFNDSLCYFTYVGTWKEKSPVEMIAVKREIDRKLYLAAPLFSAEFFDAGIGFQRLCFKTYNGWGRNALLRTEFDRRKDNWDGTWMSEWDQCFSSEAATCAEIQESYRRLMKIFAAEIGVNPNPIIPELGRIPANIHMKQSQEESCDIIDDI